MTGNFQVVLAFLGFPWRRSGSPDSGQRGEVCFYVTERDQHRNRKIPSRKFPDICSHVGNAELFYYLAEVFVQKTQQILRGNEDEVFVEIPDTQNTPDFQSESGNECGMESFEIEMFWSSGF